MSNLFGFPSGLSGGSKETEYSTNYNTSHVTNYNTNWNTNRSTDYNTSNSTSHSTSITTTWSTATPAVSFVGQNFQGPFSGEKRLKFAIHPNNIQVSLSSFKTSLYQGGSPNIVGYAGYLCPAYQTNHGSSPHIGGYDTPYLNVLGSSYPTYGGTNSPADMAAAKHMLQWCLDRVAQSTHKFASTSYTGGTRGEWNSLPIRNPYGALGSNDAYLLNFDHGGTHNGEFYKVFAWVQFNWNSFYWDNANYGYEMDSPRWGFYHWIEQSGTRNTQASTSKATNYTTTFPTSYTTTFQTTDGTSHTTTYNTNHTTSHITYG
jgi:hypothetical protein